MAKWSESSSKHHGGQPEQPPAVVAPLTQQPTIVVSPPVQPEQSPKVRLQVRAVRDQGFWRFGRKWEKEPKAPQELDPSGLSAAQAAQLERDVGQKSLVIKKIVTA